MYTLIAVVLFILLFFYILKLFMPIIMIILKPLFYLGILIAILYVIVK